MMINPNSLVLECPNGTRLDRLPFDASDLILIENITHFQARGQDLSRGPFSSIPIDICSLPNLLMINLTYNLLIDPLDVSVFNCSLYWQIVDFSQNFLSIFPSSLNFLTQLEFIYLQQNQLSTIDLSIIIHGQSLIDLQNNQITSIINPLNFTFSWNYHYEWSNILLGGNPIFNLTDEIFPMFGLCFGISQTINISLEHISLLTNIFSNLHFDSTRIRCSCDQFYIIRIFTDYLVNYFTNLLSSISQILCDDSLTPFINFQCALNYSTFNFSQLDQSICDINNIINPSQNQTTTATRSTPIFQTTTTTPNPNGNIGECQIVLTMNDTNLSVICPMNVTLIFLPLDNYTMTTLDRIVTLNIHGPLSSIPPNICFLLNLKSVNLSGNKLIFIDASIFESADSCLRNVEMFDVSYNMLNIFPSNFLKQMISLRDLYMQNNQLTSFDLSLSNTVSNKISLSNNRISSFTNPTNTQFSTLSSLYNTTIDLANNIEIIRLNDSLYAMYDGCYEVQQYLNGSNRERIEKLTLAILSIHIGQSTLNCSCEHFYLRKLLQRVTFAGYTGQFTSVKCTDQSMFLANTSSIDSCVTSVANFTAVRPRLCKITSDEPGIVPIFVNETVNSNTNMTYPYNLVQSTNSSRCWFTFYADGIRVHINCISGSNIFERISPTILNNRYFRNITQFTIYNQNNFSQVPGYVCDFPSSSIDLSNQFFVSLTPQSFPCIGNRELRSLDFQNNQIRTVNISLTRWERINMMNNRLTQIPYSFFDFTIRQQRTTPTRALYLGGNAFTYFDLIIYALNEINIDLRNSTFTSVDVNGYTIIRNVRTQSLSSVSSSSEIQLPRSMRLIINDELAQNYDACSRESFLLLINILQRIARSNVTVNTQCQCSSFYLKHSYRQWNSSLRITGIFPCATSSILSTETFESLTETDCQTNLASSSAKLCEFTRLAELSNTVDSRLALILGTSLGAAAVFLIIALIVSGFLRMKYNTKTSRADQYRIPNQEDSVIVTRF